jgi:hypothetical protein
VSRSAAGGLHFVEALANGRLVTTVVDPEVSRAYKNIERDWPNLRCYWDKEQKEHVVAEMCVDGELRMVYHHRTFHEDLVRLAIHRADSTKFDPMDEIEEAEKQMERDEERRIADLVGDVGEKLAKAFADDGLTVRPRVSMGAMHRKRRLRNFEAPTRTVPNR